LEEVIIPIRVSAAKFAGLQVVAKKDGATVEELVQRQMDYYTDVVIRDYVERPAELTVEEKSELTARLAVTRDAFFAEVTAAKG